MWSSLRLERKLILRDRGAIATACLLAAILLVSFVSGLQADRSEAAALRSAAESIQAEWAAQPPKNPHSAAHYGILVYRPAAPLQAIEPGVLPYQGAVTYLTAHKRNAPMLSPASVRVAETRYGGTRFSPLLQIAGGFLALVIGYLVGAREARRGMLPLLIGTGTRGGAVVAAKSVAAGTLVLLAALPALVLAAITIGGGDPGERFALLSVASLLHLFVLGSIGVAAGIWLGAARFGLAAVAFVWAMSVLIIPRIGNIAAERIAPLTQQQVAKTIEADFAKGPDGHSSDSDANRVFEQRVLKQYGVATKDELPVNFDALLMQADEEFRGSVYDRRLAEAEAVRERQDNIRRSAWAFGPTSAMLDLSVRIAGSDADTQWRFDESAEAFRRDLVGRLNRHMAENSETGDWSWTPEDRYYASFSAFRPRTPALRNDIDDVVPAGLALLGWAFAAFFALMLTARRFNGRAAL